MRALTLFALIALFGGCSQPQAVQNTSAPVPPKTTEPDKPEEPQKQDQGFNAKRVFQLKDLASRTFKVGSQPIKVWIMDDASKREEGMMWLENKEVKDNEGMLFVFDKEAKRTFWMQNTVLPLDIAYITAKGRVVNIVQGKSFDETGLPSTGPAQYVLELKKGMCAKFGIKAGTVLNLPKDVKSKDTDAE